MEKPTIDYWDSPHSIEELLDIMNVSFTRDFSMEERIQLITKLEDYMRRDGERIIRIDLKKFYLLIQGIDEAGYLHWHLSNTRR